MSSTPPLASSFGPANFTAADLDPSTMDVETMTLLVMSKRAAVSQDYLGLVFRQTQINNDQIVSWNAEISALTSYKTGSVAGSLVEKNINAVFGAGTTDLHVSDLQTMALVPAGSTPTEKQLAAQWLLEKPTLLKTLMGGTNDGVISVADITAFKGGIKGNEEAKQVLDISVKDIQSTIESLNNMQQIMMIKLQKAGATVNESYDMMSTCLKKIDDSRSSIIQKMA